ncbi:unnamed protein product [Ambrosiozyma monospora]|uniref:Unnamed protein product n=1 Tax=Ambrosiozyma monospora TaxID=43982 RepID=A0A9W7DC27_AMBMO|nr:unnamed protein product [Ambrosiozyma monospora]
MRETASSDDSDITSAQAGKGLNTLKSTLMAKPIFDDPHLENLKNNGDVYIDLVLGCSPYLISIIHRVSMLGKCYEELDPESSNSRKSEIENEILEQRDYLENEIKELKQEEQITDESSPESSHYVKIIAEIKRLVTLVYLFARIDLEKLYQSRGKITRQHTKRWNSIKKVSKTVIDLLKSLPDAYMSLLWPLFVIGIVSAQDDDERWFVLNCLTKMEKSRELGSVKAAKYVVLTVWKEKDLGYSSVRWKDMVKGRASTLSLA